MASFMEISTNFILSALVILGLFSFVIITQDNDSAGTPIIENNIFNGTYESLQDNINESTDEGREQYENFNDEEPQPGVISIVLFGIVSAGKTFGNITMSFFTTVIKLPLIVFGVDPNIANLILTYLIIALLVGLWYLYKLGG